MWFLQSNMSYFGTWTKCIGKKHIGTKRFSENFFGGKNVSATKRIGDQTYWRQNGPETKRLGDKTYRLL